jgi:hypothetical protein
MRTVRVALYTPKHQRFVYLGTGVVNTRYLSWGKHLADTRIIWGNRLLDRREGFFAVRLGQWALIRVHYG